MYNISTSLISIRLEENDKIIYQGFIPYDLLSYSCYLLPNNNLSRKLVYLIDGEEFSYQHSFTEKEVSSEIQLSTENWWWNWKEAIEDDLAQAREAEAQALRKSQNTEAQLRQAQIVQHTAEYAFERYQETLIKQKQLTEEQAQLNEAEKLRQDENRIALVRGIALDPSMATTALSSEFGDSGDIRRQVAAVMERDISISRQIIQLPVDQWMSSYEIMEIIGSQVSTDHKFAQEIFDKLPSNSSLKKLIHSFGWAK